MNNGENLSSSVPRQLQSSMYKTNSSTSLSLLSSTSDYQQQLAGGGGEEVASTIGESRPRTPDREISPEQDANMGSENYIDSFSRPLSRNSTTSCLSTTATKDGIEGNRLHRHGPTSYSNNIISNMVNANNLANANNANNANSNLRPTQIKSPLATRTAATYSPVGSTVSPPLPEQNNESTTPTPLTPGSPGDKLNFANMELHNSIFKKQLINGLDGGMDRSSSLLSATNDDDYDADSIANNYSQVSIKTTNAQMDGDSGASNHITGLASAPLITLREKINLLDTGAVERQDNF